MIRSRRARYITVGASGLLAVGLIGGGVVVAQESGDGDTSDGERQFDGERQHRPGHGRGLGAIISASGLDASTFADGFESGMTINEVLAANNVDSGLVLGMVLADLEVKLGDKVADGSLTQEQADAMLANAETKIAALMDGTSPPPGDRPHDRERDGERDGRHQRGPGLDVVAGTIGITVDELKEALQGGSTIADVAVANGSSADAVINAMVSAATDRIDQAVADGKIDADKADEIKSNLTERITNFVNNGRPERSDRPAGEA